MKKFKVLYMGSSFFSENILKTLLTTMKNEIEVVGVVCQPDRKIGRKQEILPLLIKQLAKEHEIPVFQPENIIESLNDLQLLKVDVIITCAYGQFLPKAILNLPKYKCLNIHASLLPALRGGAPIQWAIINGLQTTGITLMKMISKMDAGAIYVQGKVAISNEDTYISLVNKLIVLAQDMLIKNLLKIINDEINEQEQDENKVTFGLNIKRSDEKINWNLSAHLISCHVRGLYNAPIAYTTLHNNIYKIHQVAITDDLSVAVPGTIVAINKVGIVVATKTNNIIIKTIQPAGKKEIIAACYYGSKINPIAVGFVFQ